MRLNPVYFLMLLFFVASQTKAATNITTPEVSGTWTLSGSPYKIYNDITLPIGASLTIEPGVEIAFMGHYTFGIYGSIQAIGTEEQRIIFRANDTLNWNNFTVVDGGWKGMFVNFYGSANLPFPRFEYCTFRDVKAFNNNAFILDYKVMNISNCIFQNNYAASDVISLKSYGNGIRSKLHFIDNQLYNNHGGGVLTTLFTDSSWVIGNKFFENYVENSVYVKNCANDTSNHVLLFHDNDVYNNNISGERPVVATAAGGDDYIVNNRIAYNSSILQGAVSVSSKKALIDRNLIVNNRREQKGGYVCGVNDGGAGLHLLGQIVLTDLPNTNIYTVSNNIIANNYSDLNGAGIWAQHCKVNIVNNTIVNNLSQERGAAIHAAGGNCSATVHNNIIQGNRMMNSDTSYNVFNFSPLMQHVRVTNNLIDYRYTFAPNNVIGLDSNLYKPQMELSNPTPDAGHYYDATVADFGPTAQSNSIINQGDNALIGYGTLDFLGNPRIAGASIDMGAIELISGTNIRNIGAEDNISIYPVPANGSLWLDNTGNSKISGIRMFLLNGQELAVATSLIGDKYHLYFPSAAGGKYVLHIQFVDGKHAVKTFINIK